MGCCKENRKDVTLLLPAKQEQCHHDLGTGFVWKFLLCPCHSLDSNGCHHITKVEDFSHNYRHHDHH